MSTAATVHVTPRAINAAPDSPQNIVAGASLITLAFLLVACMSAAGKHAAGVPTVMLVFFQSAISLALFLPWSLEHGVAGLATTKLPLHAVRAIGGLLSQALMFIAIQKMPLMNTVLLSNSTPLFIPLVALVWLHEKISTKTWLSLVVGFAGVLLILKPSVDLVKNPAALIATSAAVCSAIALVTVNRLSLTDPTRRILFYYFSLATPCTLPLLPFFWIAPTAMQWRDIVVIGLCQATSQLLIIRAYHYAKPSIIAPFNYSVVVFSGLLGWLIWNSKPDLVAIFGVVLVCIGGVFTTIKAGPNARGHFGWVGHLNVAWLHRKHRLRHPEASTNGHG